MSGDYAAQMTLYHNIFRICSIAALCFFALAIVLFFTLKIPRVFGKLTGRLARKAIEEMREGTCGTKSNSLEQAEASCGTVFLTHAEADYGTVLLSQQMSVEFVILRSIVEVHAEEVGF